MLGSEWNYGAFIGRINGAAQDARKEMAKAKRVSTVRGKMGQDVTLISPTFYFLEVLTVGSNWISWIASLPASSMP